MYITDGDVPCKNHDPELWHSRPGSKREARAKSLCLTCDERLACLSSTLRFEKREIAASSWGAGVQPCVLGGMTAGERARLLKQSTSTIERDTA